jgi:hypothetical protein
MDSSMAVKYGPNEAKRRLLDDSIGKISDIKAFQKRQTDVENCNVEPMPVTENFAQEQILDEDNGSTQAVRAKKKVIKKTKGIMDASMQTKYRPNEVKRSLLDDSIGKIAELKAFQEKDREKPLEVSGKEPRTAEVEIDLTKKKRSTTIGKKPKPVEKEIDPSKMKRGVSTGNPANKKITRSKSKNSKARQSEQELLDLSTKAVKKITRSKSKNSKARQSEQELLDLSTKAVKKITRSKSKNSKARKSEQELLDLSTKAVKKITRSKSKKKLPSSEELHNIPPQGTDNLEGSKKPSKKKSLSQKSKPPPQTKDDQTADNASSQRQAIKPKKAKKATKPQNPDPTTRDPMAPPHKNN